MSTAVCGALGGKCPTGPKRHHKCKTEHKRVRGEVHGAHTCKYCGANWS